MLVGLQSSKTSFSSSSRLLLINDNVVVDNQSLGSNPSTKIVPSFDGRLGVNYVYVIKDSIFTIETGYQATVYMNSIHEVHPQNLAFGPVLIEGGIFLDSTKNITSNFLINGPYLGMRIKL